MEAPCARCPLVRSVCSKRFCLRYALCCGRQIRMLLSPPLLPCLLPLHLLGEGAGSLAELRPVESGLVAHAGFVRAEGGAPRAPFVRPLPL
ncbi:unnamed protein product, partial [Closterium sp. NIES-64]